ncbi:1-deoxy-D-xylulose-5-phosphate reductoisomerase, partial [Vibrio cholerae]|nr:1-deoxy-D-xylulose-5-phosphate reductoisomerase [Vibrio cholerae]
MVNLSVLGSTGSIGVSTLDVAARNPQRFSVVGLAAGRNVSVMVQQCLQFRPRLAAMADADAAAAVR